MPESLLSPHHHHSIVSTTAIPFSPLWLSCLSSSHHCNHPLVTHSTVSLLQPQASSCYHHSCPVITMPCSHYQHDCTCLHSGSPLVTITALSAPRLSLLLPWPLPSHHRGCLVAILLSPPRLSPPPHTPNKTKKPRWWCTAFVWHTAARPSERLPARHGACRAPQGWPRALQRPRGACAGNASRLDTRPGAGWAGMKPGRSVSRRGRCRPRDCRRGHGSESQGAQRPWPRLSDRLIPPGPAAQRPEASRHFLLTSARRGPADQIRSTCRGKVVWHLTLTH